MIAYTDLLWNHLSLMQAFTTDDVALWLSKDRPGAIAREYAEHVLGGLSDADLLLLDETHLGTALWFRWPEQQVGRLRMQHTACCKWAAIH